MRSAVFISLLYVLCDCAKEREREKEEGREGESGLRHQIFFSVVKDI